MVRKRGKPEISAKRKSRLKRTLDQLHGLSGRLSMKARTSDLTGGEDRSWK